MEVDAPGTIRQRAPTHPTARRRSTWRGEPDQGKKRRKNKKRANEEGLKREGWETAKEEGRLETAEE